MSFKFIATLFSSQISASNYSTTKTKTLLCLTDSEKIQKFVKLNLKQISKSLQAVWSDLAKYRHFREILKDWSFVKGLFSNWETFKPTWQIPNAIGLILIVVYGQTSKKVI